MIQNISFLLKTAHLASFSAFCVVVVIVQIGVRIGSSRDIERPMNEVGAAALQEYRVAHAIARARGSSVAKRLVHNIPATAQTHEHTQTYPNEFS